MTLAVVSQSRGFYFRSLLVPPPPFKMFKRHKNINLESYCHFYSAKPQSFQTESLNQLHSKLQNVRKRIAAVLGKKQKQNRARYHDISSYIAILS